jgi:ferredoxin
MNNVVVAAGVAAATAAYYFWEDLEQLVTELFDQEKPQAGPDGKKEPEPSQVTLIRPDGSAAEFTCPPGETILDAAEAAGFDDFPYSCRAGACAACAGRLIGTGSVVDQTEQAFLTGEQVNQGFCLTCVSRPVSKSVTILTGQEYQLNR